MTMPAPYPADLAAKGWHLDLNYERLDQSDTWALATAEQRPWLLMMWLTAWRQIPVASFPDNKALIAARIGMPLEKFIEWEPVLMSGWTLADDGRLYHKTLTECVLRMAEKRAKDRSRVAEFRARNACVTRDTCERSRDSDVRTRESPVSSTPSPSPSPKEHIEEAKASSRRQADLPACPNEDVVALYHEALPALPGVRLMTEKRKTALRSFWRWVLTSKKSDGSHRAEDPEQALAWIRAYFERAAANDFLMGRSGTTGRHAGWTADLDFLLTERGRTHVIERTVA